MNAKPVNAETLGKKTFRLSKDGRWKSVPKVPHLLQYVSNGIYYARATINGKEFRHSLDTDAWTTAKFRLADFLKEKRENIETASNNLPLVSEALELFKRELASDSSLKESSRDYRLLCLRKLQTSWPNLTERRIDGISPLECQEWSAKLRKDIAPQYFNNVIDTLRMVLNSGIQEFQRNSGKLLANPASAIAKARIPQTELHLPETDQFGKLLEEIRKNFGWGKASSELVEFLAYSGVRLSEAAFITWDDIDWDRREIIVRGDPTTKTKNWQVRRVPMIASMETLLERLKDENGSRAEDKVMRIKECGGNLAKACKQIGIPKMTHHDLRHLFATRCIEAGVDIPTVARWLGHKDGGALAMKVYGHLRNEHSQAMAQKVKF